MKDALIFGRRFTPEAIAGLPVMVDLLLAKNSSETQIVAIHLLPDEMLDAATIPRIAYVRLVASAAAGGGEPLCVSAFPEVWDMDPWDEDA